MSISSFIFGSISTAFLYQSYRLSYRLFPYLRSHQQPKQKVWIITGVTDGIGKQYAKYLTNKGLYVIGIGRNQNKLNKLKEELPSIATIQLDFAKQTLTEQVIQDKIKIFDEKSSCGFINCCGVGFLDRFDELQPKQIQQIKKVNISPLQSILQMKNVDFSIINISSASAHYPLKYSSIYSASKAYISNLMNAYSKENPGKTILNIQPWYVKTKMIGYRSDWDSVDPQEIVDNSFRLLGRRDKGLGSMKHELIDEFYWYFGDRFEERTEKLYEKIKRVKELRKKKK